MRTWDWKGNGLEKACWQAGYRCGPTGTVLPRNTGDAVDHSPALLQVGRRGARISTQHSMQILVEHHPGAGHCCLGWGQAGSLGHRQLLGKELQGLESGDWGMTRPPWGRQTGHRWHLPCSASFPELLLPLNVSGLRRLTHYPTRMCRAGTTIWFVIYAVFFIQMLL